MDIANLDLQMVIIVISCVLVINILTTFILLIKLSKTKKRIAKFLPNDKNMDIEGMLNAYLQDVKEVLHSENEIHKKIDSNKEKFNDKIENNKNEFDKKIDDINSEIYYTNKKLQNAVQKVSVVRYNPFDDVGGELCYAIALLDSKNNGVIITSIYGREACYSYAKEITDGKSLKHTLSEEEQEALNDAINK